MSAEADTVVKGKVEEDPDTEARATEESPKEIPVFWRALLSVFLVAVVISLWNEVTCPKPTWKDRSLEAMHLKAVPLCRRKGSEGESFFPIFTALGIVLFPFSISALGFGSAGVALGSIAACVQTPVTVAGGIFATLQSIGATTSTLGWLCASGIGGLLGGVVDIFRKVTA
ncbi:interferon alpha-inducible protein 6/27 [Kipferlia bialata]|uniref:Interferon alpha-inducible protein 6/27 n=1 Tax=Kipferlia bialata TaxID=797122 RepID=A0A9K3CUS7_9EUKA|nr:interferon alpha-inducible protein 6/27 [Kipferlia bialata]GIQ83581.1 interferon alpha-inducible protein 6/27 [Kipferlia bialata]|eukprot:g1446.t1